MSHQKSINKTITDVLSEYSIHISLNQEINALTTDLDRSKEDELAFYYIRDNKKAEDLFLDRLKKSKSKLIFTNKQVSKNGFDIHNIGEKFHEVVRKITEKAYPVPNKKFIGITGTNGKTSTAHFVTQLAIQRDINVLTVGTLGVLLNGKEIEYELNATSPSNVILRRFLFEMKDRFDLCVSEVSSHALDQARFWGIEFDQSAWTNLSQDHLDYHGTMEDYFLAKKKIINHSKNKLLVPVDAPELHKLKKATKVETLAFKDAPSFCQVSFNKINLSLALTLLNNIYGEFEYDFSRLVPVPGRLNLISAKDKNVVIDFAHTPDALENVLMGLKESHPDKAIVCVFGCGGDRDASKRPLMAKAVDKHCREIIVTSDNPRSEDPQAIIDDIVVGISKNKFETIVDREKAILRGIELLDSSKILVVAGKGHEEYIEINGVKHPFSDTDTVKKALGI